jgi:hypothetical protein
MKAKMVASRAATKATTLVIEILAMVKIPNFLKTLIPSWSKGYLKIKLKNIIDAMGIKFGGLAIQGSGIESSRWSKGFQKSDRIAELPQNPY